MGRCYPKACVYFPELDSGILLYSWRRTRGTALGYVYVRASASIPYSKDGIESGNMARAIDGGKSTAWDTG